jgi:hypothetical protein
MEETLILCWFIMAGSLWVAISRAMVFLEVGFLQISSLISEVSPEMLLHQRFGFDNFG